VVEKGPSKVVFSPPFHPYTKLLLSSVPEMRQGWLEGVADTGEAKAASAGSVVIGAKGCPFANRCTHAIVGTCDVTPPPVRTLPGELEIACHLPIEEMP
jgi:peptide/nickel transport system ATP-binding protein